MPSSAQQSVKGTRVMISSPFEFINHARQNEQASQADSWDIRDTPKDNRDIPGTRGKSSRTPPLRQRGETEIVLPSLKPAFGVEITRTTPVASAPPGPGQRQLHAARRRPDEPPKQMTQFWNGEGKQGSGIRGRRKRGSGRDEREGDGSDPILGTQAGQKRISQHHQRHVPIPADPAADLVVVETHLFRGLKYFLT